MADSQPPHDTAPRYTAPRGRVLVLSVGAALLAALVLVVPLRALLGRVAAPVLFAVGALVGGAVVRAYRPPTRREPVIWLIATALGSAAVYAWLRQALG